MFRYLGLYSKYPFMFYVGEFLYYSINIAAVVYGWRWIGKTLMEMGYERDRLKKYVIICIFISIPAGYISSRAAGMFYFSLDQWSLDFLLQQALSGETHTFHGSLVLPILLYSLLGCLFRYKIWHVLDTVFLYLPLAHAIGRVSCVVVGCCWGRKVALHFFGFEIHFQNPAPLWAVGLNFCIYYFLKKLHTHTYLNPENPRNYKGAITASYLMLYGVERLYMEIFRTERIVFMGLTQAQIVMLINILIGIVIIVVIKYLRPKSASSSYVGTSKPLATKSYLDISPFISLAGFVGIILFLLFLFHYFVIEIRVFPFPYQKVHSVAQAYSLIFTYFPLAILPVISIIFLKRASLPILEKFAVRGNSKDIIIFTAIGLTASLYYSMDLLILSDPRLRGVAFWPPVLILSLINAFTEEITFRLAAFSLFLNAGFKKITAILLQALLYSSVHFLLNPTLGVLSLVYGIILGLLMDRTQSITLCIICHFIIDLGAIGKPVLVY
jgi:phosphatidylglycerol:prolipoprotein diacylglycerol transferase